MDDEIKSEIEQFHGLCDLVCKLGNPVNMSADALLCLDDEIKELEAQNAEQKEALMELAEIIMTAKLKMGRLEKFADIIFSSDEVFEKWLGEDNG